MIHKATPSLNFASGLLLTLALGLASSLNPVEGTLLAVFLFGGFHNWVELRYFLTRWPSRWGNSTPYFLVSLSGAALLTLWRILTDLLIPDGFKGVQIGFSSSQAWNAVFILWLGILLHYSNRHLGTTRPWLILSLPLALACFHLKPGVVGVILVFGHPLVSLFFLWRFCVRGALSRRRFFAGLLTAIPLALLMLWFVVDPWPSPTTDIQWSRIIGWQVGYSMLNLNPGFLISSHLFLELVHYAIWIVFIPVWGFRNFPLNMLHVPLARRSPSLLRGVSMLLIASTLGLILLQYSFVSAPYMTWDLYFTLALFHVLMELVFVIRKTGGYPGLQPDKPTP